MSGTAGYDTVGLLLLAAYNCTVVTNYLAGGAGTGSTGLFMGPDDNEAVPLPAVDNVITPNTFGPGWNADYGGS